MRSPYDVEGSSKRFIILWYSNHVNAISMVMEDGPEIPRAESKLSLLWGLLSQRPQAYQCSTSSVPSTCRALTPTSQRSFSRTNFNQRIVRCGPNTPRIGESHQRAIIVLPRNGRQQSINYSCATLGPSRVTVRPRRMAAVQLLSPILREPLLVKLTGRIDLSISRGT